MQISWFGVNFKVFNDISSIDNKRSLCDIAREAFNVFLPDKEILERLDSDVIIVPYEDNVPVGFFSSDMLCNSSLIGHYESGSVLIPKLQGNGLYYFVRKKQNDMYSFDFFTSRTQNPKVLNVFEKLHLESIPVRSCFSEKDKETASLVAKYLGCEKNFDSETFICNEVYDGERTCKGSLIEGLDSKDAYILFLKRKCC